MENRSKVIVADSGLGFKDLALSILKESFADNLSLVLGAMDQAMAVKAKLTGEIKGWESIGKRERVLITLFGLEVRYCRRGYRKKVGSEVIYRYPWSGSKRSEVKLGVMHKGWQPESPSKQRFRLVGKECWGGVIEADSFWEMLLHRRYGEVGRLAVNGDRDSWVKAAEQHLPGVELYLDRFHRNRAINEGLGFSPELRERAYEALRGVTLKRLAVCWRKLCLRPPVAITLSG